MNINWHLVALIVGFAFYGFLAWLAAKRLVSSGLRQIRKLPRAMQAFFLIVAIIATVEAQKANTNGNNNASGGTNGMLNAGAPFSSPNRSMITASFRFTWALIISKVYTSQPPTFRENRSNVINSNHLLVFLIEDGKSVTSLLDSDIQILHRFDQFSVVTIVIIIRSQQ